MAITPHTKETEMVTFKIGQVVVNTMSLGVNSDKTFSTTAKVVGLWSAVDGSQAGHPILREFNPLTGRVRGGKWVADPAKCVVVA